MNEPTISKTPSAGLVRRSAARLAAVQALYSCDVGGVHKNPDALVLEFLKLYAMGDQPTSEMTEAGINPDASYLRKLVTGVLENTEELDRLIVDHLAEGWNLERIGAVLLAILRAGIYELAYLKQVPTKVIINEYIEVSRAFFSEQEVRFTNGILDKISKKVREI